MLKADRILNGRDLADEWYLDDTLLSAIGVGIYQTAKYLHEEKPSFEQFEDWILELNNGSFDDKKAERFNSLVLGEGTSFSELSRYELSPEDKLFWEENGYLIVKAAVPKEDCEASVALICDFLGISLADKESWYQTHESLHGIMVQLFQHPLLQKNRESEKIKAVYEQLWGRTDLWVNTDKVGFNPPETEKNKYRGTGLHWDVSLVQPIPFGTQGILYLTDTTENQGAFTCVPGFQNTIEDWLNELGPERNPRMEDLTKFNAKPIAAQAGDFIIWHHALPHGASPNTASLPRFVQYINYSPLNAEIHTQWR